MNHVKRFVVRCAARNGDPFPIDYLAYVGQDSTTRYLTALRRVVARLYAAQVR